MIDGVPLHIEQAQQVAAKESLSPLASFSVGDARKLEASDAGGDAVLLMGPLYHLTERHARLTALREARRILKRDGLVFAVGISRFTSALDGLVNKYLDDPEFVRIVQQDLANGQHRNPTNHPAYFTTTFFHAPHELQKEIEEAGLRHEAILPIEGPAWLLGNFPEHWSDPSRRELFCFRRGGRAMDRKALIREYKERLHPMGVYLVRNTVKGKSLVGVSVDLPAMLNRHRAQLRFGTHVNRALQHDWNEFGPEAFEFHILDTLKASDRPDYDPSDDLRILEDLWLEKLSPFEDRGYNTKPKKAI
ncbi:MAG: methyltransferase domain-containing protein [Candidatus Binatia bacterium]